MNSSRHQGHWLETSAGILYVVSDTVQFEDDFAHWNNAMCRLLEISDEKARELIERTVERSIALFQQLPSEVMPDKREQALAEAVVETFDLSGSRRRLPDNPPAAWGTGFAGEPADTIFASSISGNRKRLVVGSAASEFGWQVDAESDRAVPASSVEYDRSYYESPRSAHCGMRDYIAHDDWRMEKSRRLMRTVVSGAGSYASGWRARASAPRALDVGSATGYFRKAMDELGFEHYGIDLSHDAIALCRETLGYETWQGTLFDLPKRLGPGNIKFQIITLWDTIEHLDDPLAAASVLRDCLDEDGLLVVRTPSLTAFEAAILSDMYYSYKLDHIKYFSPRSLTRLMELAGLRRVYMETTSHLFKGLLGANYLHRMGRDMRGADIVALYSR